MFININKLMEDGVKVKASITEFYPLIEESVAVPASKVAGKPLNAFGDCGPDGLTIGEMGEELIVSLEKYTKILNKFVKEVNEDSKEEISLAFDMEQMYDRYLLGCSKFAISGIAYIVNTDEDSSIITSGEQIMFEPAEGIENLIDIESYWKATNYVIPNLVADVSTVIKMYKNYMTHSGYKEKDEAYPSILLLESESIKEFVDTIKESLEETDLSSKEILELLKDGDIARSNKMTPYFKRMLSKYDVSQSMAAAYVAYCFGNHYKKVYEKADIEALHDTTDRLLVKLAVKKAKETKKGSSLF